MHILIVSSLFPPDIAPTAKYVKLLAGNLSKTHKVSVLHFGHLPEKIENVSFASVEKGRSVLTRIFIMCRALIKKSKQADVVLLQNGPSIELPALLAGLFLRRKTIYMISDQAAHVRTKQHPFKKIIQRLVQKICMQTIHIDDLQSLLQPMVHPLEDIPEQTLHEHKEIWQDHRAQLEASCATIV